MDLILNTEEIPVILLSLSYESESEDEEEVKKNEKEEKIRRKVKESIPSEIVKCRAKVVFWVEWLCKFKWI